MKVRCFCLSVVLMLAASVQANAGQQADSLYDKWNWNFTLVDLNFYPGLIKTVSNVPVEFRTVPIHKDDSGAGRPIVLQDGLRPGTMWSWSLGAGKILMKKNDMFAVNMTYTLVVGPRPKAGNNPNGSQVNFNYQPGQGSALVYYGVAAMTRRSLPGAMVEYKHQLKPYWWAVTGYRFTPYTLWLGSGWDRHNSLEGNRYDVLSNNYLHEPYVGIAFGLINFTAGPVFQQVDGKPLGERVTVEYAKHIWKTGVSFNIPF